MEHARKRIRRGSPSAVGAICATMMLGVPGLAAAQGAAPAATQSREIPRPDQLEPGVATTPPAGAPSCSLADQPYKTWRLCGLAALALKCANGQYAAPDTNADVAGPARALRRSRRPRPLRHQPPPHQQARMRHRQVQRRQVQRRPVQRRPVQRRRAARSPRRQRAPPARDPTGSSSMPRTSPGTASCRRCCTSCPGSARTSGTWWDGP